MKPDCTFSTSFTLTSGGVATGQAAGWGIVLDGGNEAWAIHAQDSSGSPVVLATMKRISPLPAAQ